MRRLKATFVVIAVLIATVSVSAFARGHSGAGRSHGSHASSSGGVGFGSIGSHGYSGVRAPATHVAPPRHFAGSAGVAVVVGVPLYAPLLFPAPGYDYSPSPTYIEQAPGTGYWYFCPQSNAYYPYVQECPGGWQPVLPQPPG
jgi:hypothetical protein